MTNKTTITSAFYPDDHLAVRPAPGGRVHLVIDEVDHLAELKRARISVDPDELRDAIDKATGEREEPKPPASKPYRPIDRDRLLRHIEDVEASLTRRNERWEKDQERIRELEADLARARSAVEVQVQRVKEMAETKTAREYLDLAWDAAHVPADGMIHEGEEFICKDENGIRQPGFGATSHSIPADLLRIDRRLLDPRPEPTETKVYHAPTIDAESVWFGPVGSAAPASGVTPEEAGFTKLGWIDALSEKEDVVNTPAHYRQEDGLECIEITAGFDFIWGSATKYVYRCLSKDKPVEDLRKALRYIEMAKERGVEKPSNSEASEIYADIFQRAAYGTPEEQRAFVMMVLLEEQETAESVTTEIEYLIEMIEEEQK